MKKETGYIVVCYVIWGIFPLFWNLLLDVDSYCLLGWRALWSGVVAAVLIGYSHLWKQLWETLKNPRLTARIMTAGLLIYVNWGVYIWCNTHGHRLDCSLAYYMTPLISILLGLFFFRERLDLRQWLAVGITLCGVVYTVAVAGEMPWISFVLGGSFALYGAVKKPLKVPFQIVLAIELLAVAPISVGILLWSNYSKGIALDFVAMGGQAWLIPISGVVTVVPLVFFAKGIAKTSMTLVGILMYMNPTLQMLMALLLGDVLTGDDIVLFVFVWLGVLVYIVPEIWQLSKQKGERVCESSVVLPEGDA
ncbi:EamA family transporter RarD [Bengtsoniella intestinalis]|uniref:EamA family transporter RarD n=1 Tax=Bengtsoniella intestinalis TaxID=3073143 RepID=UPI00391F32CD